VATPGRRTDPGITDALFSRGFEFDFFQAVRLLSWFSPERKPVGGSARPSEEIARFGAWLSLAFPASAVDFVERNSHENGPARMTVTFLGLTGTRGVLPTHYTEHLLARKAAKDDTLLQFLDLFNHRFVSLFYRAWQKHHPVVLYEMAAIYKSRPDFFTQSLFALIGLGTDGLHERLTIRDEGLLRYAGLIAQAPHSASALRGILQDYFSVRIETDQFLGSWYELEEADRCYLSEPMERNQLGFAAFAGDKVWDQQARFRIRVGPVSFNRFRDFLPDGCAMAKLIGLTRFLVGHALAFEVQVFLSAPQVPYCRLSDEGADAPRLGWMGWLKTEEFRTHAGDAVFAYVN
jgi:type VI secretion system protein ImpH